MPVVLTLEGVRIAETLVRVVVEVETDILRRLTSAQRSSLDIATSSVIDDLTS